MKELTTEQKAKRYDEALKVARDVYTYYCDDREQLRKIESIFPELAESEEEKIRKDIISFVEQAIDAGYGIISKERKEEWIDWLEKQGNLMKALQISNARIGELIEKNYYLKEQLEKQGEQKPADEVESKFHKGEWLCENEPNNYARFIQILEIVNVQGKDRYRISRDIHKDEDVAEFRFVEKYYHKFDIQDAKDGDVLFTSSTASHETFVFKNIDEKGNAKCYFAYDSEDGFREGKYHFIGRATDCKPATKEQRDLLLQKMKEAGYEWDADKKELKKIEQKPAWSEEDERLFQIVIDILDRQNHLGNISRTDLIACVRKLKSFRPQNKWKPSDEQMKILNEVLNFAANHENPHWNDYIFGTLHNLIIQLKKLREE